MPLNDDNRPSTRHHGEMTKWVAGRLRGHQRPQCRCCLSLVSGRKFLRERSSDLERLNNCCSRAVWLMLAQGQGNCKEVV